MARLATAGADGRPRVVPITFVVDGGQMIYTAVDAKPKTTTRLRRLRNISANPRAAVLADHYEAERYPQYRTSPPGGPVIRVQVERWTGWAASAG